MTQFRDFDLEDAPSVADREPIEFGFQGGRFRCVPDPPVGSLLVLSRHMDGGRDPFGQVKAMASFLRAWIVPEQRDEWDDRLCTVSNPGKVEALVAWLVEQATERPTTPPSGLPASPMPDGGNSTAAPPWPGPMRNGSPVAVS